MLMMILEADDPKKSSGAMRLASIGQTFPAEKLNRLARASRLQ
jgi:hypothetical protein